jgi:hypothetical protein
MQIYYEGNEILPFIGGTESGNVYESRPKVMELFRLIRLLLS